jgi:mRNA interferase MazF
MTKKIPDRGDVIWVSLNPQVAVEQSGRRPALVLSPASYNRKVGLAIICPITSQIKGYPFEVRLPEDLKITGAVLADQVRSIAWEERHAKYICRVPMEILEMVLMKLNTLLH